MAEYAELGINVRLVDEASAKAKELRENFKDMNDLRNKENQEKLKRYVQELEKSLKQVAESIVSGRVAKGIADFIKGFGKIGLAITVTIDAIKTSYDAITEGAQDLVDLKASADKFKVHPADLEAIVKTIQRTLPYHSKKGIIGFLSTFMENIVKNARNLPEFRNKFFKDLYDPGDSARMSDLLAKVAAAPTLAMQIQLVVDFSEQIRKAPKDPKVGAERQAEFLEEWGLPFDIAIIKELFKTASRKAKEDMDISTTAAKDWIDVSSQISINIDEINRGIFSRLMDDPVIGGIVKTIAAAANIGEMYGGGEAAPDASGNPIINTLSAAMVMWLRGLFNEMAERRRALEGKPPLEKELEQSGGAAMQPLFDPDLKQKDRYRELIIEFKRFNSLLSGEAESLTQLDIKTLSGLSTKTPGQQGKPGGPGGAYNNDLSQAEFNKRFAGTKFEGMYETIVNAAHKHGMPASLAASIFGFETGWGKSRVVRELNNPAGLMTGTTKENKEFQKFDTLEEGIDKAIEVQKKLYTQGGETIPGMGKLYAEPGAKNDPHGTNKSWPGSVASIQKKLQAPETDVAPFSEAEWAAPQQTQLAWAQPFGKISGLDLSREYNYNPMTGEKLLETEFSKWANTPGGESENVLDYRNLRKPIAGSDRWPILPKITPAVLEYSQRAAQPIEPSMGVDWESAFQNIEKSPEYKTKRPEIDAMLNRRNLIDKVNNVDVSADTNLEVNVKGPAGTQVKTDADGSFAGKVSTERQIELQK